MTEYKLISTSSNDNPPPQPVDSELPEWTELPDDDPSIRVVAGLVIPERGIVKITPRMVP